MKLTLPFPPSVNSYWRAPSKGPLKGRHLVSETGRKFQQAARAAIIEQLRAVPRPSSDLAEVHIVLYPPDERRRDIDNYNKALFDALTLTGVWEDDSQVKRMLVEWGPVVPKGKVEMTITPLDKVVDTCTGQPCATCRLAVMSKGASEAGVQTCSPTSGEKL